MPRRGAINGADDADHKEIDLLFRIEAADAEADSKLAWAPLVANAAAMPIVLSILKDHPAAAAAGVPFGFKLLLFGAIAGIAGTSFSWLLHRFRRQELKYILTGAAHSRTDTWFIRHVSWWMDAVAFWGTLISTSLFFGGIISIGAAVLRALPPQ